MTIRNLIYGLCILLLFACSEGKNTITQSDLVANLSSTQIMPGYETISSEVNALDSSTQRFIKNPTTDLHESLKKAWQKSYLNWKAMEIYNFGPIKNQFHYNEINYWPTDTTSIMTAIQENDKSNDYLESLGSNVKGFSALEYLLYGYNNLHEDRPALDYLGLLTSNLAAQFDQINESWKKEYKSEFTSEKESKANTSLALVVNSWIYSVENIKSQKIGIPAGIEEAENGALRVEAPYSKLSIEVIEKNISSFKSAFEGENSKGIDDYLLQLKLQNEKGEQLSTKILSLCDEIMLSLEEMETLKGAIKEDPQKVKELYLAFLDLSILLKNDLSSQLNTVTTFSDNDGD
jgi:predicted lipoprotein